MPAEVVECDVLDPNIVEGESSRVEVVVQNVGLEDDSAVVDVFLDGTREATYTTSMIPGGQSETNVVSISPPEGNYQVEVEER